MCTWTILVLAVANLGPGSQKYFSQLFISSMDISNQTIAIIGLGYVGLPLAVEFGKVQLVIGFDINKKTQKHRHVQYSAITLSLSGFCKPS